MNAPQLHPSFVDLAHEVKHHYPNLPNHRVMGEIHRISRLARSVDDLQGMRVLDLGSGSIDSTDASPEKGQSIRGLNEDYRQMMFQPWYSRVLAMAGANPTAVDIHSNDSEDFRSVQADLTESETWKKFEDESYDAVNNYFFTARFEDRHSMSASSPQLIDHFMKEYLKEHTTQILGFNWVNPFAAWTPIARGNAIQRVWEFNDELDSQVQRILKESGVYSHNDYLFEKQRGQLTFKAGF